MNCIFCDMASRNAPGYILWQDQHMLVILSLEGHPLIMPIRHFANLEDFDDASSAAMMRVAKLVACALRNETDCEGINLVLSDGAVAGQDVFHLHIHVKPRWKNDGVVLWWDTETAPIAVRSRLAAALTERLTSLNP
jgi:histidine triad (HIT) family protein